MEIASFKMHPKKLLIYNANHFIQCNIKNEYYPFALECLMENNRLMSNHRYLIKIDRLLRST